ncbi:LacI family transcriptional regulator [Fodinisporobacter ferrooxydans]|uniref:LacI family transcriptional regulator n=1 Tax=Fodinisporobacter ferrooxydans TaxID=2901836 RepID=A0ABY4CQ15_9BACL|nr:LacI family transcriptional regulator [Alicyclobacillaceae bacterium MYW30-H2]
MPTILDVARKANVSAMTVSRVINGSGPVNEETRRRVEQAMKELDYYPNSNARSLVKKETRLLSLLITDITNPFYTTLARGAEDAAKRLGYRLIFCNSDEDPAKEKEYIEMLLSTQVDGVLFAPSGDDSLKNLRLLRKQGIPFVLIDREVPNLECDKVLGDSMLGAHKLMEHLIENGHRRIACITGPKHISTARDRLQGYLATLKLHDLEIDPSMIIETEYTLGSHQEVMQKLLELQTLPTAIFAANNFVALGAIKELRKHGWKVPEDISVVCFDDLDLLQDLDPFLTVAKQPSYDFGVFGVQMLVERILGTATSNFRTIVLPPEIIIRRSSRNINAALE